VEVIAVPGKLLLEAFGIRDIAVVGNGKGLFSLSD